MIWPFRRHEPDATLREQLRLVIKAARRCSHDLEHCSDGVAKQEDREHWRARAQMWQAIFYPDDGPKDYRDELHRKIWSLEFERDRLRALVKAHGIDDVDDQTIPL